jgi:hypothetical protein
MLIKFIQWVTNLSNVANKSGFDTNIYIYENYFAKIDLDSKDYISQITFWENQNLYVAEILNIASGQTVYTQSGMYNGSSSFNDFFSVFLGILEIQVS